MEIRRKTMVNNSASVMCSSPRCGTSLLLFVILVHLWDFSHGATYHSYDITTTRVCSRFRKQEFDVTMSNPIIIQSRKETIGKVYSGSPLNCDYEMEGKGGIRVGVVSVVQKMSFRSQGDYCVDYIQTIYESHDVKGIKIKHKKKKDKIKKKVLKHIAKSTVGVRRKRDSDNDDNRGPRTCGSVLLGLHMDQNDTMPPPFAYPLPPNPPQRESFSLFTDGLNFNPYQSLVSDASDADPKELKTHLYVSNRMPRVDERLDLKVVYTAYQECNGLRVPEHLFHCGYGMCISQSLVNDGFVNCPFGDCIDETNCTNARSANITAHIVRHVPVTTSSSDSGGGTWGGVIVFLIISGLIFFGIYYCCKQKRRRQKNKKQDDEDDKDTEFVDPSKPDPNAAGAYYPAQPPPSGAPAGYMPPPGGQPGYYPLVPQQGQLPPPGYPGPPASPGPGYMPPPDGQPAAYPAPQSPYPPMQTPGYPPGPPTTAPPYPSMPSGAPTTETQGRAPPQMPPGGGIGFSMPPPGGYPPPQGGYPPPQGGYPPPQGGYPPPQGGYPPPQGEYPPPQGGYPPPNSAGAPGTGEASAPTADV